MSSDLKESYPRGGLRRETTHQSQEVPEIYQLHKASPSPGYTTEGMGEEETLLLPVQEHHSLYCHSPLVRATVGRGQLSLKNPRNY